MSKSKEKFMREREREVEDMYFDTLARFQQEERERLATMMDLIITRQL